MSDRMVSSPSLFCGGCFAPANLLVRVSAKELTSLILDEERLRSERSDRKLWKSRVSGIDEGPSAIAGGSEPRSKNRRPHREADEDAEMRLALEASKYEAEEEKKRRERAAQNAENDDDLAKAIKLSKEEEERRRQELENNNASSLFDDLPPAQPQATGFNQGYQQQPAVDWFGNPMEPQQPQSTGFLNQQYAQQTGYQQPQQTGYYQNGFGAQPTGYDQFAQQQQQQFLQPQQTAFNPYAQQQQQQDIFAPQQQQQLQPGSHNPWASQQQPDALKPMPTGSNNPFAQQSAFGRQPTTPQRQQPTLSSLSEQKTATQFNSQNPITNFQPTPQPNPITSFQPRPQSQPQQQPQDPHHARLNALLASGEGQDTFGNTGDLRIPAQHTAPGTFVNSAGAGLNRLHSTPTGTNNPFLQSQFTGMPTAQYQQTAQTGMGKPWGGQQGQQQQQQQHGGFGAQGGSLIDL